MAKPATALKQRTIDLLNQRGVNFRRHCRPGYFLTKKLH